MLITPISYCNPTAAFQIFMNDPHAALLHSTTGNARFSILATDPFCVITATHDGVEIDGTRVSGDPFSVLERELGAATMDGSEMPPPFAGGAIGYFGYELGCYLERLPPAKKDLFSLPLMDVGLYDCVAVFDHTQKTAWIAGRAKEKRANLHDRLAALPLLPELDWSGRGQWRAELTQDNVERRIKTIIDYIYAGDIFQANFTQRFFASRPRGLSDFEIYRRLHKLSPAPFAAFLRCGNRSVASASPERFLRLDPDGTIEACPIKGTRPRNSDPLRDATLAHDLRKSAKDNAENLMIVDLMRSDLGRVCQEGSIRVPQLCALQSFASVHHLVSRVEGKLRPGLGPIDVLRAAFPGGSITGAPKIRAMEIIHELEPAPRGVYCGCLGYIGFNGAMDMSMAIRTLTLTEDTVIAQAGGGIVADSDPRLEYEESMVKIAPLLAAITGDTRHDAMARRHASGF